MYDTVVNRESIVVNDNIYNAYDVKFRMFSNGNIEIKKYLKPIKGINDKLNVIEDDNITNIRVGKQSLENVSNEIRIDSLTRSRDLIMCYACENEEDFHSFITLTFDKDINDITDANKIFARWRKQFSKEFLKQYGYELKYLGVPEFQKNGRVHYHLLTNCPCDSPLLPKKDTKRLWNPQTKKSTYLKYYDIPYWKFGFSSAFDIEQDTDENFNIALYITKYLYKDFDSRLYGHTRVLKSNNLSKPNEYLLLQESITYKTELNYILNNV